MRGAHVRRGVWVRACASGRERPGATGTWGRAHVGVRGRAGGRGQAGMGAHRLLVGYGSGLFLAASEVLL